MTPDQIIKSIEKNGLVIRNKSKHINKKILAQGVTSQSGGVTLSPIIDSDASKNTLGDNLLENLKSSMNNRIDYYNNAQQDNWNQDDANPL